MITDLFLQGFKCFVEESFQLGRLTLLSGLNSSGKSSFLQAIRLLHGQKKLEGFGTGKDIVSDLAKSCRIGCNKGADGRFAVEMRWERQDALPIFAAASDAAFCDAFASLSAARLGPELELPLRQAGEVTSVGERGEDVLEFIEAHSELSGVPAALCAADGSTALVRNISAWLELVSPGISFDYQPIPDMDRARAMYGRRRPTNVGFGLAYTLPVIANVLVWATLVSNGQKMSPLLLLENPEAHLHPRGQTQMGKFLAAAAAAGVQIILETHSDHLLNGIRLAVREGTLDCGDSYFYFFRYDAEEGRTFVEEPVLDEKGYFDEWPDGFFDETERVLAQLF